MINTNGLLKFTINGKTRYVQSSLTDKSSPVGMNISDSKSIAATVAESIGLQQPATMKFTDEPTFNSFLEEHKKIVIKPSDGSHGDGVTTNITNQAQLEVALKNAMSVSRSKNILLQQQITGHDIRVLMIDGKLAAAAIRTPANITGDGKSSIAELIDIENSSELRGTGYRTSLNVISTQVANDFFDDEIHTIFPEHGENVQVAGTANIGTGGTATDITDELPDAIIQQSVRLLDELSLQCGGVDFIAADIQDASSYYFIEVNASPSFGLHMKPTIGKSRPVHKLFVDMLLRDSPDNKPNAGL